MGKLHILVLQNLEKTDIMQKKHVKNWKFYVAEHYYGGRQSEQVKGPDCGRQCQNNFPD